MIEAEVGDPADQRALDDVGRVEPAAEPDFENAGIGGGPRKGEDGRGGRDLEEARLDPVTGIEHFGQQRGEGFVFDQSAGDADPFVEADEMGAGEGVDLEASRFEHGAEKGDGRAFAVGSGDMKDRRERVLRTPEPVEHRANALEPEPVAGGRDHESRSS